MSKCKIITALAADIHSIFGGTPTKENIEEIFCVVHVIGEVKTETEGITDPAALVTAIANSTKKHLPELPTDMQVNIGSTISAFCEKISSLPLDQIEGLVKAELSKPVTNA